MQHHYYTEDTYNSLHNALREDVRHSAKEIVPLVLDLIPCKQVIDVGCGDGTWLRVFKEHGVEDILGVDGDYVDENILVIPKENFVTFDLKNPLCLNRQFDLVVSLEVAEHLPAECAEVFIDSLTSLGSAILFSAAIPYQDGINHINLQWPDYWASLFQKKDYVVVDCIRKKIWHNHNVQLWYIQNILLFVNKNYLENNPLLRKEIENTDTCLSVVHPKWYINTNVELLNTKMQLADKTDPEKMSLKKTLDVLPKVLINAIKRRIKLLTLQD